MPDDLKRFETLRARAALVGYQLAMPAGGIGNGEYWMERTNGAVAVCDDLDAVESFLDWVAGRRALLEGSHAT